MSFVTLLALCVLGKPVVVSAPKVKAPACHRAPRAIEQEISAEIIKEFTPEHEGGKAGVAFPCDGLGRTIKEIVVETGSGHGGSLELWRARRRSDGQYDVRGIVYRGASMTHTAANPPHEQASGIVALPDLEKARAATVVKIKEIVPPPPPNGALGTSSSFSSNDFHFLVRFVDDAGRVVERRYTGYEGSMNQAAYLGLQVTATALEPITSLAPNTNLPDPEDEAFFAERFNAAVPHFDDDFYWWVMERYVDLARTIGTTKILRGLHTRLFVKDPSSRSQVDAREDAVDAMAKITGWDARDGGKTVEEAADEYLAKCR